MAVRGRDCRCGKMRYSARFSGTIHLGSTIYADLRNWLFCRWTAFAAPSSSLHLKHAPAGQACRPSRPMRCGRNCPDPGSNRSYRRARDVRPPRPSESTPRMSWRILKTNGPPEIFGTNQGKPHGRGQLRIAMPGRLISWRPYVRSIEESASMPHYRRSGRSRSPNAIRSGKAFAACQGNQHLFLGIGPHLEKTMPLRSPVKSGAAQKGYFKQYIEKDVYKEFKRKKEGDSLSSGHEARPPGTLPQRHDRHLSNIVNMALEASDYELYAGQKGRPLRLPDFHSSGIRRSRHARRQSGADQGGRRASTRLPSSSVSASAATRQ